MFAQFADMQLPFTLLFKISKIQTRNQLILFLKGYLKFPVDIVQQEVQLLHKLCFIKLCLCLPAAIVN